MTIIHAGAVLERPPGKKYGERLRFAELMLPEAVPKPATIRGWAASLSKELTLSVVLPTVAIGSDLGPLRFDAAMEEALSRCIEGTLALGARFVVLSTDGRVTTGQRHRDLLAAWVDRWPSDSATSIVWHPSGLWDPELAAPFARKLGVTLAIDPLDHEVPRGAPTVYARLRAIGLRSRFTETLLLDVVDALTEADVGEAWVAIESPRSFKEAVRLSELAA